MGNPFQDAAAQEQESDGKYVGEGTHVLQLLNPEDASTRSGDPQIAIQWQDSKGATIKEWVWYNADRGRDGLWKLIEVFQAVGVSLPDEGEFDPDDKGRVAQQKLDELHGKFATVVVEKRPSYKDPTKEYPEVIEHLEAGDTSAFGDVPAVQQPIAAAAADDDIPF